MTTADSLDFLRRSLEDLDDELAAGDISPTDHARLRDDYIARLARALRAGTTSETQATPGAGSRSGSHADPASDADVAAEADVDVVADAEVVLDAAPVSHADVVLRTGTAGRPEATGADQPDAAERDRLDRPDADRAHEARTVRTSAIRATTPGGVAARTRWRRVAWGAAVLAFAVGAGMLVARASGTRTAGQSASGDVRTTVRQQLDRCLQLSGQGQLLESVKCYDAVLADQPSSAEAYTYRAWTLVRAGDQRLWPTAQQNLDQAVALDPSYPDARVFRAVLERNQGRLDDARADLATFDALNPPQMMRDLVDQMGLRASLEPGAGADAGATAGTTGG